ncbi:MAG: methyltransferase domain-containing protein [Gammaproteobacteria bacterium]|nr:MAG: methyltransferase domain-containing protein [Gammaproteobacteria bacterium]
MLIDPEGMDVPLSGEETDAIFEAPPYWSFCWGSGRALAQRLLSKPELVAGKTVLDFGCGSGVVAIAAAMAGACRVIACDSDPVAREAALINAALNHCNLEVLADFSHLETPVDLLLAADVLYDSDNLPLLQLFRRRAERVLLADSRISNLREPGYSQMDEIDAVTVPDLGELDSVKTVRFYRAGGADYVQSDH